MWSAFYRILAAGAKYGANFAKWCWANRSTIWYWLNRGLTVATIVEIIVNIIT